MKYGLPLVLVALLVRLSGCALITPDYALRQALSLYARSDYEGAREKLKDHLQRYPDHPEGLFYLAKVERDGEKAADYYRRFLSLYPDHPLADEATISLGKSLYTRGLYLSTRDCLSQFVGRRRKGRFLAEARYWLATTYVAIEQLDSALAVYDKLLKEDPESDFAPLARLGMGDCHFLKGNYVAALQEYQEIEENYPESDFLAPALLGRARCHQKLGEEAQAEVYHRRLLVEFPESYEAKDAQGQRKVLPPQTDAQRLKGKFAVQVGAFGSDENAQRLRDKLVARGYEVQVVTRSFQGNVLHLVWIGAFDTREDAEIAGENVQRSLDMRCRIVER